MVQPPNWWLSSLNTTFRVEPVAHGNQYGMMEFILHLSIFYPRNKPWEYKPKPNRNLVHSPCANRNEPKRTKGLLKLGTCWSQIKCFIHLESCIHCCNLFPYDVYGLKHETTHPTTNPLQLPPCIELPRTTWESWWYWWWDGEVEAWRCCLSSSPWDKDAITCAQKKVQCCVKTLDLIWVCERCSTW